MTLRALAWLLAGGLAAAQTPSLPSLDQLQFPPLPEVRIPEVAVYTLPNGMKLYLLENHELPLVGGFALIRTGNLFDPRDKIGLAGITGEVLRTGGTKDKTGDEIDEQLENIAASVESGIGETSGSVSFNCLKENADEVLGVFKELLTAPEFRPDKIELAKTRLRTLIARRNDDADSIAGREFAELVYGKDTPYGWRMEYEHLERIERQDLIEFHKRYFFPANIILAVQGDFDTAEMRAKLEKLFADWTAEQPAVPRFPPVVAKPVPGIFLATKEDVTQTFIRLGHLGGMLKDKDYPALEVMGDILGGGFSSRLFQKVRTQLGYAYRVSADWSPNYNHPGVFRVAASTRSETTTDTIEVMLKEIERLRREPVTEQELKTAKDTVLNSFVFNFDSAGKTLNRLVTYEYHGYPKDFIFQYQKAVREVTAADVLRVARQYLHPENLTIVAVGKPSAFGRPLAELKMPVKPIDLTIPARRAAKADAQGLAQGRELLKRGWQVVGGAEKPAARRDVTLTAMATAAGAGGSVQVARRTSGRPRSISGRPQQDIGGKP